MGDQLIVTFLAAAFGCLVGFFGGLLAVPIEQIWREAVTRGYADYCPATDGFAWKGECK